VLEIIRPGVLGKAKLVGFWGFQHELGLNHEPCSKCVKWLNAFDLDSVNDGLFFQLSEGYFISTVVNI